jgi:UDP-2-acetamido-2-deoxy-ribo-hexuluronate aminotransferase
MADVKVPFYGHVRQYHNLKKEIDGAVLGVLEGGVYTLGPRVKQFEGEVAAYMGMKRAIALNSGTDAIWFALRALGVGEGDEVITTSNTFWATVESILLVGATPVLVDIDKKTRNIDIAKIEEKITPRTKAIIPVHLFGQLVDMPAIDKIAKKHNLKVIEDCAQSIGAAGDGFKVGQYSDAVAISFITAKNLGCFGDGGATVTNRDDMIEPIQRMRNHGSIQRSVHSVGWNSRLDEIHAAVLSVKLKELDNFNDARIQHAAQYDELLKGSKMVTPYREPGYRHVYHLYVIESEDRDGMQKFLKDEKGIIALTNYPIACHQQEGFPFGKGDPKPWLPRTEWHADRVLSLPMYPELTEAEVKYVASSCLEWEAKSGVKSSRELLEAL